MLNRGAFQPTGQTRNRRQGRVACLRFDSVVHNDPPFSFLSSCIQCMDTMLTPNMTYLRRDRQRGDVRHALLVLDELGDLANRNGPA
jgi:hypothetical protein